MYDSFRKMVNDIFNNEDFVQYCYINGIKYKCLATTVANDFNYSEAGFVDAVDFYLDVQLNQQSRNNMPKANDKIRFREKNYKISHVDVDSALATLRLYLISLSKGK